ncbi:MAG: adenosylmethionine decarboxylase [Cyanophyceae cyanobacterium]
MTNPDAQLIPSETDSNRSSNADSIVGSYGNSNMASHWLVDCYGCQGDRLHNAHRLEQLLITAADRGSLSVLRSQSHQFHPHGATVLLLLSESHLSLHTWPEKGYAALDLFTCGDRSNPAAAYQTVLDFLCPDHHHVQKINRSMTPPSFLPQKISTINKLV